jgi:hypothetical protein
MSYLVKLNQVLATLAAVDSSVFTGTEDEMALWDAVIEAIIEIVRLDPTAAKFTAGMDPAAIWQFAQESDFDSWRDVAARIDVSSK